MSPGRFAHVAANDTLPKLLRHNARQYGVQIALREKALPLESPPGRTSMSAPSCGRWRCAASG